MLHEIDGEVFEVAEDLAIDCYILSIIVKVDKIGNNIEGQADFEQMGWDVAISGDGQTIIVGSPGSSVSAYGAGQVKILRFDGLDWMQIGTDILGLLDEDNFGRAVDISSDGNTVVVINNEDEFGLCGS